MPSVQGRAVQVPSAKADFELVQKEFPAPGPGQVRIRVQACGICHSDVLTKEGLWPGIQYPCSPGHEIAGIVDAVGADVPVFKVGDRVGLGWHGGHCNYCEPCRRGDFILCKNALIAGISYDGGYADYVIAPANALAFMPDGLSPIDAGRSCVLESPPSTPCAIAEHAPATPSPSSESAASATLPCSSPPSPAIAPSPSLAEATRPELQKVGGAKIILSTVTAADAIEAVAGGVKEGGTLLVVGVPERPLSINAIPLVIGERAIKGWPSGTGMDSEDTLNFSALTGIRPQTEVFPLEKAAEGYERMMSGKARFRAVLTTGA
jgi:D-arabinose 1-dehydrogenase-like Zn-dependent alcohol dehydrogenase